MFYSETLLSKTGPLARVWLSANIERKLSKNHVLQTNVKDSVEAIVTPNQAPLALRLSGQLLLGVVRIYRRKANYLLDDCNEALLKIKMAFQTSGNNDMAEGINLPSRDALMLPDVLTEGDVLEMPPLPDAAIFLSQIDDNSNARKKRAGSKDINLQEDFVASQFLQSNTENYEDILEPMDELELGLDLGFDHDTEPQGDSSLEIARSAPDERDAGDDLLSKIDIQMPTKDSFDTAERDTSLNLEFGEDGIQIANEDSIRMSHNDEDVEMYMGDDQNIGLSTVPLIQPERISESPLSDIDDVLTANAEAEREHNNNATFDENRRVDEEIPEISLARKPAQRARRQRQLQPDPTTELSSAQIKSQQTNRDKILHTQSLLPREPRLIALMHMQKTGAFVSNIISGYRSDFWAPELRGMLSLGSIQTLKRKRNTENNNTDITEDQGSPTKLRLDLGEDEAMNISRSDNDATQLPPINEIETTVIEQDSAAIGIIGEDVTAPVYDDEPENISSHEEAHPPTEELDESIALQNHTSELEPMSVATKHAVHLLRDYFGDEATEPPAHGPEMSVLFEDLLPTESVSRASATKIFFETLILGTKDAIKIEQPKTSLGASICIRPKPGLWSAWAEREINGDDKAQENEEADTASEIT
ncbi:BgTH12-05950 [Blumeria graminis f. sp. triticale]|uniref:BgTH12-05950 n=1 Tax=Blumeria graminis f. sp. triticale TaxID=1689686 RepID=A0A9W4GGP9_BLUGR|nr:BgTH12-05950 [Blumeria graminis f. sp. triticale]